MKEEFKPASLFVKEMSTRYAHGVTQQVQEQAIKFNRIAEMLNSPGIGCLSEAQQTAVLPDLVNGNNWLAIAAHISSLAKKCCQFCSIENCPSLEK